MSRDALLGKGDPEPVFSLNADGSSPFLLIGDHAGNAVPHRLGSLGLLPQDLERHIAWDIGIAGLGETLSVLLNAAFLSQRYSRLVVDCNRDPALSKAISWTSDGTLVPGNLQMDMRAIADRISAVHQPYHHAIDAAIASRTGRGQPTILIALHSFPPIFGGIARPWHVGVSYSNGNTNFAKAMLAELQANAGVRIRENRAHVMDGTDYSVPFHTFAQHLPYAALELRHDLLAHRSGQVHCANMLASSLTSALLRTS